MNTGSKLRLVISMRYNAISEYFKRKYGEKVYKLPVNISVTCPNRDGTCGVGGCVFCGEVGAGYESLPDSLPVREQIRVNKEYIAKKYKAKKFIPYFQNFSNTYLPLSKLKEYLEEAVSPGEAEIQGRKNMPKDIVAISLATRPDCLNENHLDLFQAIKEKYEVDFTVELGLQTVNYYSLSKINRGHTLAEFVDAALRVKRRGFRVCAHLILNLPWDTMTDTIENAKVLSALKIDEVKLHALYIVKGTVMADWYQRGEITLKTREEYVEQVVGFLEYLHPDIVISRLIGRAPAKDTVFANWQTGWWKIRDDIEGKLEERDTWQGKKCTYLNGWAAGKYN